MGPVIMYELSNLENSSKFLHFELSLKYNKIFKHVKNVKMQTRYCLQPKENQR